MKLTIKENILMEKIKDTMAESLNKYVGESLTLDSLKNIFDQINNMPMSVNKMFMSLHDYNTICGISNEPRYICY
jgi:hypothetical protein